MRPLGWSLLLLIAALVFVACSSGTDVTGAPTQAGDATTSFAAEPPPEWAGADVSLDGIPPEAVETLVSIASEGPFPYRQDGSTFQNREGILPDRPTGFYREYTVETPGSPDRGARRLVVGDDMAVFYTEDHYDSFRFVAP